MIGLPLIDAILKIVGKISDQRRRYLMFKVSVLKWEVRKEMFILFYRLFQGVLGWIHRDLGLHLPVAPIHAILRL